MKKMRNFIDLEEYFDIEWKFKIAPENTRANLWSIFAFKLIINYSHSLQPTVQERS